MRGLHSQFRGLGDVFLVELFLLEEFFRFFCVGDDRGDRSQRDDCRFNSIRFQVEDDRRIYQRNGLSAA